MIGKRLRRRKYEDGKSVCQPRSKSSMQWIPVRNRPARLYIENPFLNRKTIMIGKIKFLPTIFRYAAFIVMINQFI
jgi:hypothetical protein